MICFLHFYRGSLDSDGVPYLYYGVEHRTIPNSIPTCAFYSAAGVKGIIKLDGRQNTVQYLQVLTQIKNLIGEGSIVQDHHPVHKSNAVVSWFRSNQTITATAWPPSFGDIMPMEKFFDLMFREKEFKCKGENELWKCVVGEWERVTAENSFTERIPILLQRVLDFGGDYVD